MIWIDSLKRIVDLVERLNENTDHVWGLDGSKERVTTDVEGCDLYVEYEDDKTEVRVGSTYLSTDPVSIEEEKLLSVIEEVKTQLQSRGNYA